MTLEDTENVSEGRFSTHLPPCNEIDSSESFLGESSATKSEHQDDGGDNSNNNNNNIHTYKDSNNVNRPLSVYVNYSPPDNEIAPGDYLTAEKNDDTTNTEDYIIDEQNNTISPLGENTSISSSVEGRRGEARWSYNADTKLTCELTNDKPSKCAVCGKQFVDEEVLCCCVCQCVQHFGCTRLPPYQLFLFTQRGYQRFR